MNEVKKIKGTVIEVLEYAIKNTPIVKELIHVNIGDVIVKVDQNLDINNSTKIGDVVEIVPFKHEYVKGNNLVFFKILSRKESKN